MRKLWSLAAVGALLLAGCAGPSALSPEATVQADRDEQMQAAARLRVYVDSLRALPPDSLSAADRRFLAERDAALASGASPSAGAVVARSVGGVVVFGTTVVVVGLALLILVDGVDL